MEVYYTTEFGGFYPVGTSAIVVAHNAKEARELLNKELVNRGLESMENDAKLVLLPKYVRQAIILNDGDY